MKANECIGKNTSSDHALERRRSTAQRFRQSWNSISQSAGQFAREFQSYFLLVLMTVQGIFFIINGVESQDDSQMIISGIYLISLSILWLTITIIIRRRIKDQKQCLNQSQTSYTQKSPSHTKQQQGNLMNSMASNQRASNQMKNQSQMEGKQYQCQGTQLSRHAVLNQSNRLSACGIGKQKESNFSQGNKKDYSVLLLAAKDLAIIMFSLPAIILMFEIFLNSTTSYENSLSTSLSSSPSASSPNSSSPVSLPKFWTGVVSFISLKLVTAQIKIAILQIAYFMSGYCYFMIRYWVECGYNSEVITLMFIILFQQIIQQMASSFDSKVYAFFQKYSKHQILFEALRLTVEQSDGKSELESNIANKLLQIKSRHLRDKDTNQQNIFSPHRGQSIQLIPQNSMQGKSQQFIPSHLSEYHISRGNLLDKNQSPLHFMSSTTHGLKRSITFNQRINELKMSGFYSQLFGLIPVGVAIISSNKNLLYASSQMMQMLNCQDEQKALKILLSLNTNAQKSTQFNFEDETESDDDEYNFNGPANFIANINSNMNSNQNTNAFNAFNASEKTSQKAKRDINDFRYSPQLQNKQVSGMQNNSSYKDITAPISAFVEEQRSSGDMMDDDEEEENYRARKISSIMQNNNNSNFYNNLTNNNNNNGINNLNISNSNINYTNSQTLIYNKSGYNTNNYNSTPYLQKDTTLLPFNQNDFKSPNSVNGSMMDIGTERNNLLVGQVNDKSQFVPSSSLLVGINGGSTQQQQQIGSISARRKKRKSTQNFSSKDLNDRWGTDENNITHIIQQQAINMQRDSHNQIFQQPSQLSQGRLSYTNIPLKHLSQHQHNFQDSMGLGESERQIMEEEDELGVTSSIINPELQLNDIQFQRPEQPQPQQQYKVNSPKSGLDQVGAKKRGSLIVRNNLRQMSVMKSAYDNGSDNKTEAMQREESVSNILNIMMGWADQPQSIHQNTNYSAKMAKSQKKNFTSQNYNTSNSQDFNSPQAAQSGTSQQQQTIYVKGQTQYNQSTAATHSLNQIQVKQYPETTQSTNNEIITNSLAKQLDVNREKQFTKTNLLLNSQSNQQQNEVEQCAQDDLANNNTQEQTYTKSQGQSCNVNQTPSAAPTNQNTSGKKKPMDECKQDFEELMKQKQKMGYIQQEGNVSTMQIEYQGQQYILKIIIHQVIVGSSGEQQKVAMIVLERMWQDFMIKKVEDLINQKMQLFGSLSHELRTPLNCSISMLEVLHNISLQDTKMKNQLSLYVQPALNSNKLLLNMINDILDFVQLENGSFKFGFVEFDLQNLLKECVSLVQIQAKMKKLTIACYYDPQTPKIIKSDPNRIRQVILNFLSNALKFTLTGHIIVYASAHRGIQEVTIGVKDTGIGINQENINEIFKVFNKIDLGNHQKLNLQGCGVGLALSNSIARALGPPDNEGIQVQSEKDQGSTFSFVVQNQNPQIHNKEEDVYENDDISNERLFANFSIIRPKVTQINKENLKNKKQKGRRNSYSSDASSIIINTQSKANYRLQKQSTAHQIGNNNQENNNNNTTANQMSNINNAVSNTNSNTHNNFRNTNTIYTITKIGVDGMSMGSDNSVQFNGYDPSQKMRSVSLTQLSQGQRKNILNSYHSIAHEEKSPNDKMKNRQNHFHFQNSTVGPQSPTRNNSQNAYPSFVSVLNANNTEKKMSLLETIKSKDFQDMHLLDHSKYDSPAGFNSYHNEDKDQFIIKSCLEIIQNNQQQFGCSCPQILIVDDQEFNLFSLSQLLQQFYGIISDTALNYTQVMQKIKQKLDSGCCKTYKIIFMDINMPQKNGYEVARDIKFYYSTNEILSSIKPTIIACSAYNGEEDKKKALANGMVDFVTKPIMKAALDIIISKYYDNSNIIPQQLLNK